MPAMVRCGYHRELGAGVRWAVLMAEQQRLPVNTAAAAGHEVGPCLAAACGVAKAAAAEGARAQPRASGVACLHTAASAAGGEVGVASVGGSRCRHSGERRGSSAAAPPRACRALGKRAAERCQTSECNPNARATLVTCPAVGCFGGLRVDAVDRATLIAVVRAVTAARLQPRPTTHYRPHAGHRLIACMHSMHTAL